MNDSLKATLGYGEVERTPSLTATRTGIADTLSVTVAAAPSGPTTLTDGSGPRATVLPRRKWGETDANPEWDVVAQPRYENLRVLGRGGMGEVALVQDHDINRTVAMKRLIAETPGSESVLRFADEARAIGQLEHPGIVPIYDVGVDEQGKPYLVMKNVEGETLEAIIEQLRAGNPETLHRFPHAHRAHVFLEILQAVRYAHDRNIIHRDLKPANIMVGRFGEVTIMDWGLAKKLGPGAVPAVHPEPSATASQDGRLLSTAHGALLGTPLYMSPEQATGDNDGLDERSDIFSLCLVLYEFLVLEHPLRHAKSVQEIIAVLTRAELPLSALAARGVMIKGAPAELMHVLTKGLHRDREKRYRNVAEFEDAIGRVLAGTMRVQCHVTLAKRVGHALLHFIDRHALAYTVLFLATVLGALGSLVAGVVWLVRSLA